MAEATPLDPEEMASAVRSIAEWRIDPDVRVVCPRCGAAGLSVIDRSARPYSEWYVIACGGCALEATIQIPMSPPAY